MNLEEPENLDVVIHACGTVGAGPFQANQVISGSSVLRCQQCGAEVWASPASIAAVTTESARLGHQLKTLCISCALPYMDGRKGKHMPRTPGQKKEIAEHLAARQAGGNS